MRVCLCWIWGVEQGFRESFARLVTCRKEGKGKDLKAVWVYRGHSTGPMGALWIEKCSAASWLCYSVFVTESGVIQPLGLAGVVEGSLHRGCFPRACGPGCQVASWWELSKSQEGWQSRGTGSLTAALLRFCSEWEQWVQSSLSRSLPKLGHFCSWLLLPFVFDPAPLQWPGQLCRAPKTSPAVVDKLSIFLFQ